MSDFTDMLDADMGAICGEEFGETITYLPQAGGTLTLAAIVIRNPPEKVGVSPRMQTNKTIVSVQRSLLAANPVLDGDRIILAGTTKKLTVVKLINESDPGAWHLVIN